MKTNEKEMLNSEEVDNIYSENGRYKLNRRKLVLASILTFRMHSRVQHITVRTYVCTSEIGGFAKIFYN